LRLLRLQVKKLSRTLQAKNNKSPAVAKLSALDKILEATPFNHDKFFYADRDLRELLAKEPSIAKIQFREAGAKEWSAKPDAVSAFKFWGVCEMRCPCRPANGKFDYKSGVDAFLKPGPGGGTKPTAGLAPGAT
jgi:hypothetical protein